MRITIALVLLALSTFAHAEYGFNDFYTGIAYYEDDKTLLGESAGLEFEFVKNIGPVMVKTGESADPVKKNPLDNTFFRADVEHREYDIDGTSFVNGIPVGIDVTVRNVSLSLGKFFEEKREDGKPGAKAFGYLGLMAGDVEVTVAGSFTGSDDDTGTTYGGGIIVPRGEKLDFLLGLERASIYERDFQNIYFGFNANTGKRAAVRALFVQTDESNGFNLGVRFKLQEKLKVNNVAVN